MAKLTKSQIADRLREYGIDLTAPQVKKASHADLKHQLATALRKGTERKPRSLPEKVWPGTRKAADVTPARAGSKRAVILEALHRGATIEVLMEATGWNRATVSSAITTDVVGGAGLGVRRDAKGVLHLVLPKGMVRPPIVEADESRAAAVTAACR